MTHASRKGRNKTSGSDHSAGRSSQNRRSGSWSDSSGTAGISRSLDFHGVQTKVKIGPTDDLFEHEADRVADNVVADRVAPPISRLDTNGSAQRRAIGETDEPVQRQMAEEREEQIQRQAIEETEASVQRQTAEETEEAVQRQTAEEDKPVQTESKGRTGGPNSAMAAAASRAIDTKGGGQPLGGGTRSRLERSIGTDLSGVRVHTDGQAAAASQDLNARAFTHGRDIWLGQGESPDDLRLMGHETAHVIQQDGVVRRQPLENEVEELLPTESEEPEPAAPEGESPVGQETGTSAAATTANGASEAGALPPIALPIEETSPQDAPTDDFAEEGSEEEPSIEGEAAAGAGAEAAAPGPAAGVGGGAGGPPPSAAPAEGDPADLLPVEPTGLSEGDQETLNKAQKRVKRTARNEGTLPSADTNTTGARGAVTEPDSETLARAQAVLVAKLGSQAEPSPEIVELCERIKEIIKSKRPPDEDSLLKHNPEEAADQAGSALNSNIEGEAQAVNQTYAAINDDPSGTPTQIGRDPEQPPGRVRSPEIDASAAAPTPLTEEDTSFENATASSDTRMRDAGIDPDNEVVAESARGGGPHAEALENQEALKKSGEESQAAIQSRQSAAINTAQTNMAALQAQALEALNSSRRDSITGAKGQQGEMADSETLTRDEVSRQAEEIFTTAQTTVSSLLEPLATNAMARWDTEKARLSREFDQSLASVDEWIKERHSGVLGGLVSFADSVFGYPDWIVKEYDRAEKAFGDGVCQVLLDISREVNSIIATCEQLITKANEDIDALFKKLPGDLDEWAAAERARFQERLDGLQNRVHKTRDNLNRDLTQQASQAVDDVRQEIHARREAAKGLIGRIADAIGEFLEDPLKAIINGLLRLVGIEPSRFWAVVNRIGQVLGDIVDDPLGFAGNLLSGIGQGFERFFDNFKDHILGGFFEWLFSGLGSVGVEIPKDFSLKSIISFILQLMGITWARIRKLLAKHIGEENVALIEKAWEIVSTLIQEGPSGIFEMIKEQLNPQEILQQILDAAIDFMIEALIKQVTVRIALLFNPVGAIAQAVEAIYKVLKWIFENAARLFAFIETVVSGMVDVVAGNIAGLAKKVEGSLRLLISPVIDFLMGYVGLGDLPDKIADTIRGFQTWIEGILDKVIGWLAEKGRQLLSALGLKEDDEPESSEQEQYVAVEEDYDAADGTDHELSIEKGKDKPLILSSEPMSYTQFINSVDPGEDSEKQQALKQSKEIVSEFYKVRGRPYEEKDSMTAAELTKKKNEKKDELNQILDRLWAQTTILLGDQGDVPTGNTKEDPIPFSWYKPIHDSNLYPPIELVDENGRPFVHTIFSPSVTLRHPALPGLTVPFGVNPKNFVREGHVFQRIPASSRGNRVSDVREMLKRYGVDITDKDIDHILDLNFGGHDAYNNLWPFDRAANRSAGSTQNSQVLTYKDTETGQVRPLQAGHPKMNFKWFKVEKVGV